MKIDSIRPMDNVTNHYVASINGISMTVVTRPGQSPEEVLAEAFADKSPSYAEKRLQEYPSVQEQLDMIYHDIDAWRGQIAAIKAKHPK